MSDSTSRDDATSSALTPAPAAKPRRWDPFSMLAEMESEMDRFFGHRLFSTHPLRQMFRSSGSWSPQIDMFDRDGNLVIEAELPGVNRDDIEVSIEDTDLIIKGERSGEREVEEEAYYRMERYSGSFYRRIPLPKGPIRRAYPPGSRMACSP